MVSLYLDLMDWNLDLDQNNSYFILVIDVILWIKKINIWYLTILYSYNLICWYHSIQRYFIVHYLCEHIRSGSNTKIQRAKSIKMLIGSRTKRPKNSKLIKSGAEHRLQIYKVPPKETVTLQEFEEYAVERLKGNHWLHYLVRGGGRGCSIKI